MQVQIQPVAFQARQQAVTRPRPEQLGDPSRIRGPVVHDDAQTEDRRRHEQAQFRAGGEEILDRRTDTVARPPFRSGPRERALTPQPAGDHAGAVEPDPEIP